MLRFWKPAKDWLKTNFSWWEDENQEKTGKNPNFPKSVQTFSYCILKNMIWACKKCWHWLLFKCLNRCDKFNRLEKCWYISIQVVLNIHVRQIPKTFLNIHIKLTLFSFDKTKMNQYELQYFYILNFST